MKAIDLYSGIGGWTLGFKLAGVDVIASFEWWRDANETHNKNFGTAHKETNIRTLKLKDLPAPGSVQFVVGSPPCTQFSLANRGGKGDIADGMIDIRKFLEVVEYLKPKYWAMENVPRVAQILKNELDNGALKRFKKLFNDIRVYNCSDFGVPQDRKRMIAGRLPFDLLDSYRTSITAVTLGHVIDSLRVNPRVDPVYGLELMEEQVSDHILEPNLSDEEARINMEAKAHHPVYNKMSFPDRQDRSSRTITALCTRVSRESIVIKDGLGNLRRLTIRERGCLQSFPINYQFFGRTYASKIKMIGNAVPPLLTFYIAQAMLEIPAAKVQYPKNVRTRLQLSKEIALSHQPENQGATYSWSRTFWMAINGLRFGSGVRFELRNHHDKDNQSTTWRVGFYYGNSKRIKDKSLDDEVLRRIIEQVDILNVTGVIKPLNALGQVLRGIKEDDLQKNWTNKDRTKTGPIELIDQIANCAKQCKQILEQSQIDPQGIRQFVFTELNEENRKLVGISADLFVGMLIGAYFNVVMKKKGALSRINEASRITELELT